MKIAIIGAGIFGCHIALSLSNNQEIKKIVIYEKKSEILTGASRNNQHRLHLGYHYPRSPETIKQAKECHDDLLSIYENISKTIENNYYLIAKDGLISGVIYQSLFPEIEEVNLEILRDKINVEKIDKAFKVKEEYFNLSYFLEQIKERIINNEKIIVKYNTFFSEFEAQEYDYVINATYYDCDRFTNKIKVKYELCCLPLIKNPFRDESAITIMDGEYSSLYPTEKEQNNIRIFTLSNVKHTPFYKTYDKNEFNKKMLSVSNDDLRLCSQRIFKETKKYYKIKNFEQVGCYVSPKVKIENDIGDIRTTEIVKDGKYITVLQGKISTAEFAAKKIWELIK